LLQDVRDRDSFREKNAADQFERSVCYDIKYYVSHLSEILLRIEFFKIIQLNILLVNLIKRRAKENLDINLIKKYMFNVN